MACLSSYHNGSNHRSFLSKPVHPLSFPTQTPGEGSNSKAAGPPEFEAATLQRDCLSSTSSSTDFADVSEPVESEICGQSVISSDGSKCGFCERFLSQKSPWSSRRIVRSGDMPVAGILSCRHVFHAECLEQTTPKTSKNDPPCPLCLRLGETNSHDYRVFSRLRNSFPRLRALSEDGQSRPWGSCGQMGDCVERGVHTPARNTMLLVNRNRIKRHLSLKGNPNKEFPGKLRKSVSHSSQLFSGKSKTMPGPSSKGW